MTGRPVQSLCRSTRALFSFFNIAGVLANSQTPYSVRHLFVFSIA